MLRFCVRRSFRVHRVRACVCVRVCVWVRACVLFWPGILHRLHGSSLKEEENNTQKVCFILFEASGFLVECFKGHPSLNQIPTSPGTRMMEEPATAKPAITTTRSVPAVAGRMLGGGRFSIAAVGKSTRL